MKRVKSLIPFLVIGFLIACLNEACKAPALAITTTYVPVYVTKTITKRDTIKKSISQEQMKTYLANQYKYNFDSFFKPEFDRLSNIINVQAKSIDSQAKGISKLTTMYSNMRTRSIRTRDSMQNESKALREEILSFQLQTDKKQQRAIDQNTQQLNGINKVTNFLVAGFAVFVVLYLVLMLWAWGMWKRMKNIDKQLQNV